MATAAETSLEKSLVLMLKDPNQLERYYKQRPHELDEAIDHLNKVLNLPSPQQIFVIAELHLELRSNSHDPVDFECSPSWPVLTAKYKICEKFPEYGVKNLFVLYGRSIAKDWAHLRDCGIEEDGDILYVYVYLPHPLATQPTRKTNHPIANSSLDLTAPVLTNNLLNQVTDVKNMDMIVEPNNFLMEVPVGLADQFQGSPSIGPLWICRNCSFYNENWQKECSMCSTLKQTLEGDNLGPQINQAFHSGDIGNANTLGLSFENFKKPVGWQCPQCTFFNEPTRPGCEICTNQRPVDYQVPEDHQPSEREQERLSRELIIESEAREQQSLERKQNYRQLLSAEDNDIITSTEPIECMICFSETDPEESIVLRNCLHKFCKDCVIGHVTNSEEAVVTCPYMDDNYKCTNAITHREIKALLTEEDFKKFLDRGLMQAEKESTNSFHCKTPDCHGWCVYEDDVNTFDCPVCKKKNCILCKAIHEGKNCKEYQDEILRKAATDVEAKKTKELLNKMIKAGDAMNCPKCNIIIQKKIGCDWIRCSMCKLEICWVTKGPRWGPNGTGDITAGCKCGVNGKPCHAKCGNCH